MVSRDDRKMTADLAHANIAEIETGKTALEKSQNPSVKKFAQRMVGDHTAALQELQTLAQAKKVKLPDSTDMQHKTLAVALKAMTGNTFDNQYMKRAGVNDHQRAIQLLQKAEKNAKDPELKAMAVKMLPTVQGHLKHAQQGAAAVSDKNKLVQFSHKAWGPAAAHAARPCVFIKMQIATVLNLRCAKLCGKPACQAAIYGK